MSGIIFGTNYLSTNELQHLKQVQQKYDVDESTVIAEAIRRFLRKIS